MLVSRKGFIGCRLLNCNKQLTGVEDQWTHAEATVQSPQLTTKDLYSKSNSIAEEPVSTWQFHKATWRDCGSSNKGYQRWNADREPTFGDGGIIEKVVVL